jgi:hypothetical protein
MKTVLETLKSLDPADRTANPHTPRAQSDLDHILRSPRPEAAPQAPRSRGRLVVAAGVAAAVAVGVFVVPVVTGGDEAFATWTAQPTGLSAGKRDDAASSCRQRQGSGSPEYKKQLADARTAVAERRGNWTLVALVGEAGFSALCVTDDSRPFFQSMFGSVGSTGSQPGPRGLTAVNLGTGILDNHALSVASGFAGADVTGVSYTSPTKGKVSATVSAGQFALWLPGSELESSGVPLQATYKDGTSATVTVRL